MSKLILLLVGVILGLTEARQFQNPVIDTNCPDPGVILVDGVYYAVTTSSDVHNVTKFPIHTSTNLQDWTQIGYIFNAYNFPAWSKTDHEFWAPEIHRIGDQYVVYYTGRVNTVDALVIGAATSKNVAGPYTPLPEPLLYSPGYSLWDSTVIKNNNTLMLAVVENRFIRVRNLTADGLGFKDNNTVPLFQPDLPWEGATVEGQWYIYRNNYHYIFYSGNNFCSDQYAVGVARSRSPAGPYEKLGDPLLVSNDQFKGPGHGSIVRDIVNDGWVFVYHAYKAGAVCGDNPRLMLSTSMEWGEDDWPKKMSIGN